MIPKKLLAETDKLHSYLSSLGVPMDDSYDRDLMLTAFMHKSYSADFVDEVVHNERLEFLGDSILGGIIASKLYRDHPDYHESTLTLLKIKLVKEPTLAIAARNI